jgi:hypothetical protein
LRQQLGVLKRKKRAPRLRRKDQVFWVVLSRIWPNWRKPLHLIKADTVVGWQRQGFKMYWARLSRRRSAGRRQVSSEVRALIRKMSQAHLYLASANCTLLQDSASERPGVVACSQPGTFCRGRAHGFCGTRCLAVWLTQFKFPSAILPFVLWRRYTLLYVSTARVRSHCCAIGKHRFRASGKTGRKLGIP